MELIFIRIRINISIRICIRICIRIRSSRETLQLFLTAVFFFFVRAKRDQRRRGGRILRARRCDRQEKERLTAKRSSSTERDRAHIYVCVNVHVSLWTNCFVQSPPSMFAGAQLRSCCEGKILCASTARHSFLFVNVEANAREKCRRKTEAQPRKRLVRANPCAAASQEHVEREPYELWIEKIERVRSAS